MQAIYSFIVGIMEFFRSWIGLIFPIFRSAADFRKWPRWVFWMVYLAVMGLILWLLWEAEKKFEPFEKHLLDWPTIRTNHLFLPLAFLFLHALGWVLYLLKCALSETVSNVEYPDIEEAWRNAVQQLDGEGVKITELPMFLILGSTVSGNRGFFEGSDIPNLLVAPGRGNPPLHLFVSRSAIFVMASGVSAWSTFCNLLNDKDIGSGNADEINRDVQDNRGKSLRFSDAVTLGDGDNDKELLREMQDLLRRSAMGALSEEQQARLRELTELTNSNKPKKTSNKAPDFPTSRQKLAHKRLRYLCRLMLRDRRPWCPINGTLVLVPWKLLQNDDFCKESPNFLLRDLTVARDSLNLHTPVCALVCDVETAIGFQEFRSCFSPTVLKQRLGQKTPLTPAMSATELPPYFDKLAAWLGQTIIPKWILQFLRMDQSTEARHTPGMATSYNSNLYLFLREMYMRAPRLGRILKQGMMLTESTSNPEPMPLFGGCYLAATGESDVKQAFLPGVFDRLVDNQNYVSWTRGALDDERWYARRTILGYLVVVLLILGIIAGISWVLYHAKK